MKISAYHGTLFSLLLAGVSSHAQVTMSPLLSFGGGDGWLAPGEGGQTFLGTGSFERGLAYSGTLDHLYLVSRAVGTSVRILNPLTGIETGTLDVTGIAGGTFALNKIAVGGDGAIYGANLRTGTTAATTFRIYKWNAEGSTPALVFDHLGLGNGSRVGDDFDAIGSGAATRLAAGYNIGGTAQAGTNGYAIIDPTASAATPTSPSFNSVGFATTPPNEGDFRLGITFVSAGTSTGTVLGDQLGSAVRLASYADASGTLDATLSLSNASERLLDYAVVGGVPLLATVDIATSAVRLYDMTTPSAPGFLTSGNTTTGATVANANFAGDARFGAVSGNSVTLYAMNTNNGIQAFTVTVPEPSALLMLGLGIAGMGIRRRR